MDIKEPEEDSKEPLDVLSAVSVGSVSELVAKYHHVSICEDCGGPITSLKHELRRKDGKYYEVSGFRCNEGHLSRRIYLLGWL